VTELSSTNGIASRRLIAAFGDPIGQRNVERHARALRSQPRKSFRHALAVTR